MEESYRDHKIISSTWQLGESGHWEPRVQVIWNEAGKQKEKALVFTRSFSSAEDAQREGLRLAQKWIDDGKPELRLGPT